MQKFAATDVDAWKSAVYLALKSEKTPIAAPDQEEDSPGSVLLELLNLQKWSLFEKRALMYTVHIGGAYIKGYRTGRGADSMWDASATIERVWDIRTPLHFIVDALAKDAIGQPEAHPVKVGGLMLLPKN